MKRDSLLILFFGRTSSLVLRSAIPPFIPFFAVEFHWTTVQLGILASSYLWSYSIAQLLWGPVVDRWGAKIALLGAWLVIVVSSMTFAFASGLTILMVSRIVFGFGVAAIMTASVVYVNALYERGERATALGIMNAASSIGHLIAGIGIPLFLFVGVSFAGLAPWRTASVLIALPAIFALLGVSALPKYERKYQKKRTVPFTQSIHNVLLDKRLYLVAIGISGYVAGINAVTTWSYLYLYEQYHLSLVITGTVATLAIFVPAIPGAVVTGWLSDRTHGRARISMLATIPLAFSVLTLAVGLPLIVVVGLLAIYGFFTLSHTPLLSLPTEIWTLSISGTDLGIISSISQLAAALTPALTGYILSYGNNYTGVWLFASLVYLLSGISLFFLSRAEHPKAQ